MYYYKIFNIAFKSNFKLSVLPEISPTDFEFEVSEVNITPKTEDIVWYLEIPYQNSNLGTFAKLGKDNKYFVIKFNGYLDFFISKNRHNILFSNKNDVDSTTIQHLLIDQVVPRLVSNKDNLVIHASAVEYKDKVIAFIGESGSGKSTSVLALTNDSKKLKLLCDDSLLLRNKENEFLAHPSYFAIRLWPDSLKALTSNNLMKQNVSTINNKYLISEKENERNTPKTPKKLDTIYYLDPIDNKEFNIEKMSPKRAFEEITKGIFRLDIYNKDQLKNEFNFVSQLTKNTKFFNIKYRQNYNQINEFTEKVTKHFENHF